MVIGVTLFLLGASAATCLSPSLPHWATLLLIPGASTGQGFFFPATSIAVLALSAQDEQAVVTTTLGLMRNLGTVLGVAISSWVLQNALVVTLDQDVTGADKARVIQMVRKSVKATKILDPAYKAQGKCHDALSQNFRCFTLLMGTSDPSLRRGTTSHLWDWHHLRIRRNTAGFTHSPTEITEEEMTNTGHRPKACQHLSSDPGIDVRMYATELSS